MGITTRTASVTDATRRFAYIVDNASRGLTIEHLKAFIEQADRAELPAGTRVRLRDELQTTTAWHTVEIQATSEVSVTRPAGNEEDE